jgi:quinol-cytochrome oxidoreductase complex cytochrome b subunit
MTSSVVLGRLAAWLFGVVVAVMTVGTLAVLYMTDVGAEILLAVIAAVATL